MRRAAGAALAGSGLLAGLFSPCSSISQADDSRTFEAVKAAVAPNRFSPPTDAQPIWLPKRPAAKLNLTDHEDEAAAVPGRADRFADDEAGLPQPTETVTASKPVTAQTGGSWQSGLKWRIRHPSESAVGKELSGSALRQSSSEFDTTANALPRKSSGHFADESRFIRQTSQLEVQAPNPFADPFNDGQNRQPANPPAANLQPPAEPPAANQPAPPAERGLNPPMPPLNNPNVQPPAPEAVPEQVPDLPRPPANQLRQPNGVPFNAPPPAFAPQRSAKACNRVYNDRDCCDEDMRRNFIREKLRNNSLSNISLDITPNFKPDISDRKESEAKKRELMESIPAKTWKNRDNQVLARGRMIDFDNSRVVIVKEDGEKIRVSFQELSDDDLCFVSAWWGLPSEYTFGDDPYTPRDWVATTMTWKASALCHKTLYFQETQLERYGHTTGPITQPIVSGAHFFLNIAALPYKMAINPPNECHHPLGYYRPGNCAPWLLPPVPISIKGALAEAGAVVGGIYVLP